jgi:hypothetical protein
MKNSKGKASLAMSPKSIAEDLKQVVELPCIKEKHGGVLSGGQVISFRYA